MFRLRYGLLAVVLLFPAVLGFVAASGPGQARDVTFPTGPGYLPAVDELGETGPSGASSYPPGFHEISFQRQAFFKSLDPRDIYVPPALAAGGTGGPGGSSFQTHVVSPGETLWRISRRYGVTPESLAVLNGIADTNKIRAGQKLLIPATGGPYHRVEVGETLWRIAQKHRVSPEILKEINGISDPTSLQVGRLLRIPTRESAPAAATIAGRSSTTLLWPLAVPGTISSGFGPRWGDMHTGIDIAAAQGAAVRAAAAGVVAFAGWKGSYGRAVVVRHPNGLETLYGHNSAILTAAGERVDRGQVIARVGTSGRSTGSHLHFEVLVGGNPRNPLEFLGREPDGPAGP